MRLIFRLYKHEYNHHQIAIHTESSSRNVTSICFYLLYLISNQIQKDDGNEEAGGEVSKGEKARLREMQKLKKQKIKELLDAQNAAIDAEMNNKGKGPLKYLLQQTEIFAHFAKSGQSSQKKAKGKCLSIILTKNILRKRKMGYLGEETLGYLCSPLLKKKINSATSAIKSVLGKSEPQQDAVSISLLLIVTFYLNYIAVKNQKLHEQFDVAASTSVPEELSFGKPIFHGVSIFVDGFTIPSSQVNVQLWMHIN
ncbi:hypothetical protein POM88_037635 [Heracleum sosnowskyi]|uniref:Uncharacterized protein n=1 Tax=Heracleum sosnowskyi TaxID=360622 RepID=A0AAD8HRH5_9APIA|nr:hypothetical protein POM88_037635 [Heracleum sosnowskyi]